MIQCHKCVTQLLDVTDQAHTHPLGLQVPTHSQLVNNHTVQAAMEVPHHGKSTGGSLGHCFPLRITWQWGSIALEKSKDTSRERYVPTENYLCFGDTPVVSLMGLILLVGCQVLANGCQRAQHHRDP